MGCRNIVVALRDTSTCLEWVENFRTGLVSVDDDGDNSPEVECGFQSLYKTAVRDEPSLSSAVEEEVKKLTEQYAGEEMSITLAGHSLGVASAVLAVDEVAAHVPPSVPMAVFSFGGPRVGNQAFANKVEGRGVKVMWVVNAHDLVTRVPAKLLPMSTNGYAHVGRELRVDSRRSPYLRPGAVMLLAGRNVYSVNSQVISHASSHISSDAIAVSSGNGCSVSFH
ncbi:hypothetical protein Cni_G21918 [Canna indica]|uniref:Fungal lipase-type domain-containing protein n=1 Tax=Canna indica TaxID=4628 RepID=A0AAQ3KQX6_9LILI|nr:hypothetical protein Cni_G21918 [Canna indica]